MTDTNQPAPHPAPHQARQIAESFGIDAERYDRARPSYPDALVEAIIAESPGRDILDVGIGTGISARPFRSAGCHVLGIDVDERMAAFARGAGFEAEVARFEEWDATGRTFDVVIAGQAWHWVDPVGGAVKAAEVLRDAGLLAPFWNVFQPPPDLAAAFSAVYRRVDTGLPFDPWAASPIDGYGGILERVSDGIRQTEAFEAPQQRRFDWERTYSRQEWLDAVPTSGGHSSLAPGKLDELLADIGAAIDDVGGSFVMGYATLAVTAKRQR